MAATRSWWVYVIRRADGALYTGIAVDTAARFAAHLGGRGAKALRGRGPLQLVLRRRIGARSRALRLEHRFKRLRKVDKERLLGSPSQLRRWFAAALPPA